jgi:hypothetical protein
MVSQKKVTHLQGWTCLAHIASKTGKLLAMKVSRKFFLDPN